jgi:hypothetical protein
MGSQPTFAAGCSKVCSGPVVSLDISGVSGSAKLSQKRSFLERTQTTRIVAAKNPVQNLWGC